MSWAGGGQERSKEDAWVGIGVTTGQGGLPGRPLELLQLRLLGLCGLGEHGIVSNKGGCFLQARRYHPAFGHPGQEGCRPDPPSCHPERILTFEPQPYL